MSDDRVALTGAQRQARIRHRRAAELARLRLLVQRIDAARSLREVREILRTHNGNTEQ